MGLDLHREDELKYTFDAAAHARILAELQRLGPVQRRRQVNRYFDTPDLQLAARGQSIRLRLENDRVILTCKERLSSRAGLWRNHEYETHLNRCLWELCEPAWLAPALPLPPAIAALVAGAGLRSLGEMPNLRWQLQLPDEVIALDHCHYAGRHDYELEVEATNITASDARWRARLQAWGINWQAPRQGKLERFTIATGIRPAGR